MKKIHQVFLKHSEGLITAAVLQNKTRKKTKQKQEEVVFSRNNRSVQEVIDRPPGQGRKNVSIKKTKQEVQSLPPKRGVNRSLYVTLTTRHVFTTRTVLFTHTLKPLALRRVFFLPSVVRNSDDPLDQ